MKMKKTTSLLIPASTFCFALLLAGCPANDNALGGEGCQKNGKTYQVGETIVVNACTSCVCQKDGTVGMCTGDCGTDGGTNVTCSYDGKTYQIGERVALSACTTCLCQADGTLGLCTGACPVDASPDVTSNSAELCTSTGGTVASSQCCLSVDAFPNTCSIGACGCSPQNSHAVSVCSCPNGGCFDPARGCEPIVKTCSYGGKDYQVGATVTLSACTSCVCQDDGTLGMCTGACPPDAGTDAPSSLAILCASTGGKVGESNCCLSTGDFPNSCAVGACGCSPANSHPVSTCSCPDGTCFDPTRGCKALPNTCIDGDNIYHVGQIIKVSYCTSCVCQDDGTLGMCTGDCPVDGGVDASTNLATLCTSTGGQVGSALCCLSTSDFPETLLEGPCGCSPDNSHTVATCSCPSGGSFDRTRGCR